MTWIADVDAALRWDSFTRLVGLTTNRDQKEYCGTGDGIVVYFTTPFVGGTAPSVFVDDVLAVSGTSYSIARDGAGKRWRILFYDSPYTPASGTIVSASSKDGVNLDNLKEKLLEGQGEVRGFITGAGYFCPADDAVAGTGDAEAHTNFQEWSYVSAAYRLINDPKRAGMQASYPGVLARYADIFGLGDGMANRPSSFRSVMDRIAKRLFNPGVPLLTFTVDDPQVAGASGSERYVPARCGNIFDPP